MKTMIVVLNSGAGLCILKGYDMMLPLENF
jgi:hypothetical protein